MRIKLSIPLALLAISGPMYAQSPASIYAIAAAAAERAPDHDEELALAALEGLMAQPGDRALPILKKVLAGQQSKLIKQRALFVLSQIDSPEAQQILVQNARSTDPGMRGEAIRAIGIGGNPTALAALSDIYAAGGDDVKEDVLQAWLIADRKESVYQAVLDAKSEEDANRAIRILGAMGATEELRKLGDRPNATGGLVEAYAISGDLASLVKIANGNGDRAIRLDAIRKIGIVNGAAANAALREIYGRNTDADMREAALQGMLISGDDDGVLTLYRAAKSTDEKRTLMRYLSMMDGDAALKAIDQALEDRK